MAGKMDQRPGERRSSGLHAGIFRSSRLRSIAVVTAAILILGGSFWLSSANLYAARKSDSVAEQADLTRSVWPRAANTALGVLSLAMLAVIALEQRRGRHAASASLASLERFTRAFGSSQGLLRTLDGTISFWARGMERLYGYTAEEAVGRRSDELLRTEFSAPRAEIQATLEREGHWEGDVVKHRQDGSKVEVSTQWSVNPGRNGQEADVIVLDSDISERRDAERANERFRTLLRTVVEAAPGPIYAKDRQGRMLLANFGALLAIGKSWAEVEGRTDVDFLADRTQAEAVMVNDRRLMEAGRSEQLEDEIADADGTTKVWLSTRAPICNADGQVSGLVGFSVDITELKSRTNALVELNGELSGALADRDAALQERDILLREVYHRVKNNLQIVDGLIVMQARQMDDSGARLALGGLRNRLRALALVHSQLMHSKNLKTFDIAPFLQELATTVVAGGTQDGISLCVRAIPLEVDLDFAIPMGLLVAELVTNSIKHAFPDGRGTIVVSLECATDGVIALIVSDDGRGRSSAATPPGVKQSGLGTGIINGLVKQLQGEQSMTSEHGARTEIRVPAPVMS